MNQFWHHVNRNFHGETAMLEPKVPIKRYKDEGNIPRICVSNSIFKCLRSMYGERVFTISDFLYFLTGNRNIKNTKIHNFSIYKTNHIPYIPPLIRDFEFNDERWFVYPTSFCFCGFLDSISFIKNRNIELIDESYSMLSLNKDVNLNVKYEGEYMHG